jgi:RecB family endonuclease NucS
MIGKLEPAELRELWRHEALNFTSWLAENLDVLKEQLGFDLTVVEQEKAVGPFSADILAQDASGRSVIIENQLERTDHDHLGKLLTYLANLDAKIAIWISSDPRSLSEN